MAIDVMSSNATSLAHAGELSRVERLLLEAMPIHSHEDDGYYRHRIARGVVLEIYERIILNHLLGNFDPGSVRVIEAGAGWGMLCILLAVAGSDVVAFNGEPIYAEVLRKLSDQVASQFPRHQDRLRVIEGFFPYELGDEHLSGDKTNILVSTNLVHEFNRTSQDTFLAAALRFDYMVIDLATFARAQDDAGQQELRTLLTRGFEIETCLWENRLLLVKPIRAVSTERGRSRTPDWLLGQSASLGTSNGLAGLDGAFQYVGGHCWSVPLPSLADSCDNSEFPRRSRWRLLEDGVLLGPPHALHAEIMEVGRGRYSHWSNFLYFSTSDNSDPTSNGRQYTLAHAVI